MYAALFDPRRFGPSYEIIARARAEELDVRPLWYPLHRQPAFARCESYRVEVADRLHERGVCLPCSVGMTPDDQTRVIEFLSRSAR
jgi:pyridoxal phosphate-dependent aminotransferase EpsN